jgi:cytochrome P450
MRDQQKKKPITSQPILFDKLLDNGLDEEALIDEAFILLVAGTDTTAHTLSCAVYYLFTHKEALLRLREEISPVLLEMRETYSYKKMKSLPFLVRHLSSCKETSDIF